MYAVYKIIHFCSLFISVCILFVIVYFACAFLFSHISVNKKPEPSSEITVYLSTNGVHTDLILPVKTDRINWSDYFPYTNTKGNDTTNAFIGIGWGDKGFYLNTPTWADLTFKTAFNAVFGLGSTAVHATYHQQPLIDENTIKLQLSSIQYEQLVVYIKQSLQVNENGNSIHIITNANYGSTDAFYEANGKYNMFHTCNTWTNNALKSCGQRACLWTPFQSGIFNQYK